MAPSSSRSGARVIWICVHTAEGIRDVDDLQAYFNSGVAASSHAGADDRKLEEGWVPYDRASWTLRNGNARSDNLELCGFAAWSRKEWLDNHQGMLNNAALWIRRRCNARGIPIVKLSAADVAAGKAGVIGHADYTNGTRDGSHWDPGPGFPWDVVIAKARGAAPEENEVELNDPFVRDAWNDRPGTVGHVIEGIRQLSESARTEAVKATAVATANKTELASLKAIETENQRRIGLLSEQISQLALNQGGGGTVGNVDVDALAALLVPQLTKAVNDEADRRDRDGDAGTGQVS